MRSSTIRTVAKVLVAAFVVGAVLALAGRSIAPDVPLAAWVFWCALALAGFDRRSVPELSEICACLRPQPI